MLYFRLFASREKHILTLLIAINTILPSNLEWDETEFHNSVASNKLLYQPLMLRVIADE
jgi:hypothetical protein